MNENNNSNHLEDLIQNTTENIRQQQEHAASLAAKQPNQSRIKTILTFGLFAIFSALVYLQYPRIIAPYELPDPNTDPTVLEAELILVSDAIEAYRLEQGQYPESLDQIKLPSGFEKGSDSSKLSYQRMEKFYTLDWKQPKWHAKLNSGTRELTVIPLLSSK